MPDYPLLNPDFRDMLDALSAEGAEFIVVGAYAVSAHGAPRSTGDLDLLVRPTPENAQRVWRALRRFGAPLQGVTLEDFQDRRTVYQMGVQPGRIDLITEISGVDFERAWNGRMELEIDGVVMPVLGLAELLQNKRACGRPKDLFDLQRLKQAARMAVSSGPLDASTASRARPASKAARPSARATKPGGKRRRSSR